MLLAVFIVVHAVAYRGACSIVHNAINGVGVLYNPMWTTTNNGYRFVKFYMFGGLPIACLNGFLMHGIIGLLIAGVATWICMPIINLLFRFNPGSQFMIGDTIIIILSHYHTIKAKSLDARTSGAFTK